MARPSKLTDRQWEAIGKRLLAGESTSGLAREYGVSKGAISQRFSKRTETIKATAGLLVRTDEAMGKLNVSEQLAARSLADTLRSISEHLGQAANYGAMTAHRLSGIANAQVEKIDDQDPLNGDSIETLKGISALTRLANDSAEIGIGLLKANKETVEGLNRQDDTPEPKQIIFTVQDASS
jgi:hypothetical protein